jgi:hypothetical protein
MLTTQFQLVEDRDNITEVGVAVNPNPLLINQFLSSCSDNRSPGTRGLVECCQDLTGGKESAVVTYISHEDTESSTRLSWCGYLA